LLTGQLPFKGEHDQTVLYSILNEKPDPIANLQSDIPEALEEIVKKSLEKNPDDRYQNIDELLDDLKSISEGTESEGIRARLRKAKFAKRKKSILYASVAGLIIIMTVTAVSLFTGRAEAMDSIAVLPMANFTGDAEQEYFVDGITDELIGQLAQIGALRVISRQSVMQYKGSEKPLPVIARELAVDAVIEGTVQQLGENVRIRVQLIDALPEERNLWTQTYERAATDVFMMYSDVARAIAREIRVNLTPQEEKRLTSTHQIDPETYAAYLKGMYYLNQQTPEGIKKGLEYFHQAVENNPADPLAYAGLALGYATVGHGPAPPPDAWPRAREAALRALKLDETLAEAHAALADVKTYYEWDWEGAEKAFQRANALNPNLAMNHYHYAWYNFLFGRLDEAIVEHRRAQDLDPLTPLHTAWLGQLYIAAEQYDKAIEEAQKAIELDPDSPLGYLILGNVYAKKEMFEEAIAVHQKAAEISRFWKWGLGMTYLEAGKIEEAQKILTELEREEPTSWRALWLAQLYAALGEKEKAFRWLAYEPPHAWLPWVRVSPLYDDMRDDPRFKELLHRLNFSE
jgi:TolB-like protein/Flp pilus assembly protein TadD